MPERPTQTPGTAHPTVPADLTAADLDRLAELVYRLLRDDLLKHRERRGSLTAHWR